MKLTRTGTPRATRWPYRHRARPAKFSPLAGATLGTSRVSSIHGQILAPTDRQLCDMRHVLPSRSCCGRGFQCASRTTSVRGACQRRCARSAPAQAGRVALHRTRSRIQRAEVRECQLEETGQCAARAAAVLGFIDGLKLTFPASVESGALRWTAVRDRTTPTTTIRRR
jgi:hypothetical protein